MKCERSLDEEGARVPPAMSSTSDRMRAVDGYTGADARLGALLAASADGIVLADESGHVQRMSPAAEAMTGWPEQEAIGQSLEKVVRAVQDATREPWLSPAAHALSTGELASSCGSVVLLARGGDERPIGATAVPVMSPGGVVAGVALVLHDDEQARDADEASEQLGRLTASLLQTLHDVSRPLSVVLGGLEYLAHALQCGDLLAKPSQTGEVDDVIRSAQTAADRIRRLIAELRGAQPTVPARSERQTGQAIRRGQPITGVVLRASGRSGDAEADRHGGASSAAEPGAPGKGADSQATSGSRRARVLIVDDDPLVGTSIRRVLSREHEVVVVHSGREALTKILAGDSYSVVLCDLMMPEMTGMELHAELARLAAPFAARMVFLTGGAFTTHAREFLAAVPNPRLQKPFDAELLRSVVREVVASAAENVPR